ncbi:Heterocyst formation protein HetP [Nostoc sp. DSM 114161]|jgi:hypothetical protein|uniref:HetP family heterocyst commitment protein n=1 Tax=Nostoc sp. DSM 114161 TaxID=3440143 RepID=UPI004046059C
MNEDFSEFNESFNIKNHFTSQQLEEILKAVRDGKYSWACLLMLRFSGFNPLEYIPYRTYIRLMKSNFLFSKTDNQNIGFFQIESTWFQQGSDKHGAN